MKHTQALLVFARNPVAGQVKMRMVDPFSPEESAELYRAFLQDALMRFTTIPHTDVFLFLPPERTSIPEITLPPDIPTLPQQGRTFAERQRKAFQTIFERGYRRCVATSTDCPTLPMEYIQRAFMELKEANSVTIGPSLDGGYYLMGMNQLYPELFEGMTYSHPGVFEDTILRITATGARLVVLPPWYDVDTPEDLTRLAADLAFSPLELPHTRKIVAHLIEKYPLLASIEAFANL